MNTINLLDVYRRSTQRDDLNKSITLTGNTCFCPSCQKDMPTIKSRYENKPAQRCCECGKMLIVNK